jgi:hypothetical protein
MDWNIKSIYIFKLSSVKKGTLGYSVNHVLYNAALREREICPPKRPK